MNDQYELVESEIWLTVFVVLVGAVSLWPLGESLIASCAAGNRVRLLMSSERFA